MELFESYSKQVFDSNNWTGSKFLYENKSNDGMEIFKLSGGRYEELELETREDIIEYGWRRFIRKIDRLADHYGDIPHVDKEIFQLNSNKKKFTALYDILLDRLDKMKNKLDIDDFWCNLFIKKIGQQLERLNHFDTFNLPYDVFGDPYTSNLIVLNEKKPDRTEDGYYVYDLSGKNNEYFLIVDIHT